MQAGFTGMNRARWGHCGFLELAEIAVTVNKNYAPPTEALVIDIVSYKVY